MRQGGYLKIEEKHSPLHKHNRGSLNIKGSIGLQWGDTSAIGLIINRSELREGALSAKHESPAFISDSSSKEGNESSYLNVLTFDASKGWTGETSSFGRSIPETFLSPYYTINMWIRIN